MVARLGLTTALLWCFAAHAKGEPWVTSYTEPPLALNAPPVEVQEAAEVAPDASASEPFNVVNETSLNVKVDHALTKNTARDRIAQLLAYWDERFGVKSEWRGFRVFLTGKVLGIAFRALFEVEDGDVVAMAEDPGTIFSGAARRYVDSKLRKYLHPNYEEP